MALTVDWFISSANYPVLYSTHWSKQNFFRLAGIVAIDQLWILPSTVHCSYGTRYTDEILIQHGSLNAVRCVILYSLIDFLTLVKFNKYLLRHKVVWILLMFIYSEPTLWFGSVFGVSLHVTKIPCYSILVQLNALQTLTNELPYVSTMPVIAKHVYSTQIHIVEQCNSFVEEGRFICDLLHIIT
jgi:hypothetical protein